MVLSEATASSDSVRAIPFGFGWEESIATVDGYTKIYFAGFARVYLLDIP